ncbi:MAG: hypothetical protein EOO62_02435, partial [Hymenobacter sp.]
MWIAILLLAAAVLGAGALVGVVSSARTTQWLKPLLAFSGAYLFTLTITHLLPEALTLLPDAPQRVGYWVLAGFFGQLLLEVLSQGIEHGHVHAPDAAQQGRVPLLLVMALVVHSLLEGSILVRGAGSGGLVGRGNRVSGGLSGPAFGGIRVGCPHASLTRPMYLTKVGGTASNVLAAPYPTLPPGTGISASGDTSHAWRSARRCCKAG